MRAQLRRGLGLAIVLSRAGLGQAHIASAPSEPSLLSITREWSRASSLGDLPELKTPSDYLELRVWGGYGFGRTQGTVLRRSNGHWSAFVAQVRRCAIQIPNTVGDTASAATMHRYVVQARRQCDTALTDVGAGMRVITADTLAVDSLSVAEAAIESAWTAAVGAGVLQLPPRIKRDSLPSSDFTYVVELRRGGEYRASEIEYMDPPPTGADRQVQQVYAIASRVLPAGLELKP